MRPGITPIKFKIHMNPSYKFSAERWLDCMMLAFYRHMNNEITEESLYKALNYVKILEIPKDIQPFIEFIKLADIKGLGFLHKRKYVNMPYLWLTQFQINETIYNLDQAVKYYATKFVQERHQDNPIIICKSFTVKTLIPELLRSFIYVHSRINNNLDVATLPALINNFPKRSVTYYFT